MKSGWEIKPLGALAAFINGDRGGNYPSHKDFVDIGIPFINAGHLVDGHISLCEMNYITEAKFNQLSRGKVQENDVLFCLRGSLGKHAIVDRIEKGVIASSLVIIRCQSGLLPSYLSHYLDGRAVLSAIRNENTGSNQPNLSAKTMMSFAIPVPSIPEQQRIVEVLDREFAKIDALKANAEKSLQAAKDLFQATLKKEMEPKEGWDIAAFDVCVEKRKAPTKLLSSLYQDKGLYPIVSQEKELISGYWDNPADMFVHTRPVVIFGDHTLVVKYIDFDFVVGADGVKILEPKDFLLPKFFFYWVSSVHIKSRGYARHFRYLREASVPVPSHNVQQQIVRALDEVKDRIEALTINNQKTLILCDDLKQALLHKAFNGEL